MLTWLISNWGTLLVSLLLIVLVLFIVRKLRSDKKHGISSCGANCGCCPMNGKCHKQQ